MIIIQGVAGLTGFARVNGKKGTSFIFTLSFLGSALVACRVSGGSLGGWGCIRCVVSQGSMMPGKNLLPILPSIPVNPLTANYNGAGLGRD